MKPALLFPQGTSLKLWEEKGWIHGSSAGITSYNKWAETFEKFYFLTYGGKDDLKYSHYLKKNIIVLPKKFKFGSLIYSLLMPFIYRRELRETDIFFCAQMQGAWSAVIAKYLFKKKFILRCGYQWSLGDFRNFSFGRLKKILVYFIELITYKTADFIILTSEHARKYVIKRYHINPAKIEVIPNPVDTEVFRPLPVKKTPKSLVFVGRLEEEKNLFSLLSAIKETETSLTLFGSGSLEKELKNYASLHKIQAVFRGNLANNQLPKELNKHEIFIFPSLYEGNPKALLEAMGCGLAIIGTNVRGINEIIRHKDNGYLCEPSSESIRKAIFEVEKDEALRQKMGINARKYILENCHLDKKNERELKIFKSLLKAN